MATDAALARSPVAGGQVVQHLSQLVLGELLFEDILVVIVRKQVFDAFESRFGGGGEAIEEFHLVEHHGQIGG